MRGRGYSVLSPPSIWTFHSKNISQTHFFSYSSLYIEKLRLNYWRMKSKETVLDISKGKLLPRWCTLLLGCCRRIKFCPSGAYHPIPFLLIALTLILSRQTFQSFSKKVQNVRLFRTSPNLEACALDSWYYALAESNCCPPEYLCMSK